LRNVATNGLGDKKMSVFGWFKKKEEPEEIPKHIAKKKSGKKRE
jgi:hypothetical protein